jgi:ATP-dependent DNA helicase RecQ
MDLPDIKLVVQWKATCELSMLWQRFGRAARGTGQGATAILLVEKKDTDEERVKKADRAAKRKRKKDNNIKQNLKEDTRDLKQLRRKRPALADRGTNTQVKVEVGSDTDIGSCDDEYDNNQGPGIKAMPGTLDRVGLEECRAQYASQERTEKPHIQVRGQGPQIGSALDDFINPRGRFRCRRTVLMLFFGNDKTCECRV